MILVGDVVNSMAAALLSDPLWTLSNRSCRFLHDGHRVGGRISDRACLTGIVFALRSGIPRQMLPQELGCGSGMTCWRRLRDWQEAGVWDLIDFALLDWLTRGDQIDWSRAVRGQLLHPHGVRPGVVESSATRDTAGAAVFNNSRRVAVTRGGNSSMPMALPPGRSMDFANPLTDDTGRGHDDQEHGRIGLMGHKRGRQRRDDHQLEVEAS